MLGKVDLKDMATVDFDRLIKQKDYRAIFNDRFRFAAALAMDNARNGEFLDIMKRMETIETSMAQAKELARLNNNFAAWELAEKNYIIDCIECGSCSYTCPANRPLLDYIRSGKGKVMGIIRARKS